MPVQAVVAAVNPYMFASAGYEDVKVSPDNLALKHASKWFKDYFFSGGTSFLFLFLFFPLT